MSTNRTPIARPALTMITPILRVGALAPCSQARGRLHHQRTGAVHGQLPRLSAVVGRPRRAAYRIAVAALGVALPSGKSVPARLTWGTRVASRPGPARPAEPS